MQALQKKEPISLRCILAMVYFVAIPLTIAVNESGNSFLKLLALPIGLYFLVSLFFYKDKLELNSVHAFFALYIISAVSTLFIDNSSNSIDFVIGYIQNAGLMFCMTLMKYNKREIEWMKNIQVVLLAIMIYLAIFGGDNFMESDRVTIEIFGGESDPNYFCGFFIFPISVCLDNIAKNKYRWICIPLVFLGIYCVIMSGSRGGLMAVGASLVAFAVMYAKNVRMAVLRLVILSVIAVLFWVVILPYLPEGIRERMTVQAVIESRGTNRVDIWLSMLDYIKNSTWQFFFGNGIDAHHTMMLEGVQTSAVAHNQFIQSLYNQGVVGFVIFVGLSASAIFRNIRLRKYIVVGMVGMLVLTLSLTLNPNIKTFWNLITYAGLSFIDNFAVGKGDDAENEPSGEPIGGKRKELAGT